MRDVSMFIYLFIYLVSDCNIYSFVGFVDKILLNFSELYSQY